MARPLSVTLCQAVFSFEITPAIDIAMGQTL